MKPDDATSKTTEERLHAIERDQLEMRVRVHTMERAVGSLIATHRAPEEFAAHFERVTGHAFNAHLYDALVTDEAREHSQALAQELVQTARDEAARRAEQSQRAA